MKPVKIIIENGDLFEGTHEQFQDCFFSNEFDEDLIRDWCDENGWVVEFIYEGAKQ